MENIFVFLCSLLDKNNCDVIYASSIVFYLTGGTVNHINEALKNVQKAQKKLDDILSTLPEVETTDGTYTPISTETADKVYFASRELYEAIDKWRSLLKQ